MEEKRSRAESAGLKEVVTVLRDLVEVLRGIRSGMDAFEHALDPTWRGEGSEEESEGEGSEGSEGSELAGELVGLAEDYEEYRAFWLREHGTEYRETGLWMKEFGGKEKSGEGAKEKGKGKEKEQEEENEDEMEVDGMVAGPSGSAV